VIRMRGIGSMRADLLKSGGNPHPDGINEPVPLSNG